MKNMNFYEVSGYASWRPAYPNHPKNNQKGPGLNTGIFGDSRVRCGGVPGLSQSTSFIR